MPSFSAVGSDKKARRKSWSVRTYTEDDFGPLTVLAEEIHSLDPGAPLLDPPRWRYVCSDPHADPESYFKVAEWRSGEMVGFGYRFDPPRPDGSGRYRAVQVVVHPRWRRKGIGTDLFEAVAGEAPDDPDWYLTSACDDRSDGAWPFARKLGFKKDRVLLMMERELPGARLPESDSDAKIERFLGPTAWADWARLYNACFQGKSGFVPVDADHLEDNKPDGFRPEHVRFARVGGQRVGYLFLRETSGGGFIEEVAVLPELAGAGIGTALLISALEYLRDRGHKTVQLTVEEDNTAALKMYARLGFDEVCRRIHVVRTPRRKRRR